MSRMTRRDFLKWMAAAAAAGVLAPAGCKPAATQTEAEPTATQTKVAPTATQAKAEPTATQTNAEPTATRSGAAPTATPAQAEPTATQSRAEPTATVSASPSGGQAYMAIVHGADPAAITEAAVKALGGIERFVKSGDNVIIKPNMCVNYSTPEYAATTNPTVVATLVRLCKGAGAKRIRIMDTPYTGDPESAYHISGIYDAVVGAGGEMELMSSLKYASLDIPKGRDITSWPIYRDVMEADVVINVPIAKHHGSSRLTLGGKNLMGIADRANQFHSNLHQRIADLNTVVRPALTLMDAVRILTAHGPGGGNLADVKQTDMVIASHDIITVDSYTTTLFGLTADDIGFVRLGAEMGLGEKDWSKVKVEEISV